jgi:hypothetical protein
MSSGAQRSEAVFNTSPLILLDVLGRKPRTSYRFSW